MEARGWKKIEAFERRRGVKFTVWTGRQKERGEDKQSRPITGAKTCTEASWPHGCPRSTVNRLDMAEKQVVAVASTSSSGSEPSSQREPAACPSSPTPDPPNPMVLRSRARLLCRLTPRAPPLGLALDLPPARRDAPRTAPDTWMILVGSGEGKETPC